eukprot:6177992-Pleurochrysis_carterae.AAC.4
MSCDSVGMAAIRLCVNKQNVSEKVVLLAIHVHLSLQEGDITFERVLKPAYAGLAFKADSFVLRATEQA